MVQKFLPLVLCAALFFILQSTIPPVIAAALSVTAFYGTIKLNITLPIPGI